jgi:acylphosphatase
MWTARRSGWDEDQGTVRSASVVRYRVVVTGTVQGVWFRESCRREAHRLGVAGWVRNRGDGAVVLEAEGPEEAVAQLVAWCQLGPPAAQVDGIELHELMATGQPGFAVIR